MIGSISRAGGAAAALLTTLLALLLLSSTAASAADATPPDRCRVSTFEQVVAVNIRDEDLSHTRFAVRAISRDGNRTYAFLGRVDVDAPRTSRDTETLRFDTDLSPGDWSFAVRSFDDGDKSSWTGCGTETISPGGDLFLTCGVEDVNQARGTVEFSANTIDAVPDDLEFRFSARNDIYGVTAQFPAVAVTQGVDRYTFDIPDEVRPGSWFVTLDAYRGEVLVETASCFKFKIRPGIEPLPDFSCTLSASADTLFAIIDHSGLPDGNVYAVNLERGERPNEDFIYIGRFNEIDDQDDDDDQGVAAGFDRDLVEPNDGWRVKARYITPDGTKSERIDCGEAY